MSITSWLIMLNKALDLRVRRAQGRAVDDFWFSHDFSVGLKGLGDASDNPFAALAGEGAESVRHHKAAQPHLHQTLDVSEWLTRALAHSMDASTARMQSGLAVLASIGSTAPFIGLFGTVCGIYHALMSIGTAGPASIDKVATPIGEALVMTALGLAVAIPAVLGYNALLRGNKTILIQLHRFAHDLHAYFLTGARVHSGGAAPGKRPHRLQQA